MTYTLLGIPNCDRVRAARRWCAQRGLEVGFRDIRQNPLEGATWLSLLEQDSNDVLINRRGPVYRRLALKGASLGRLDWVQLLMENPTLMKRPVLLQETRLLAVGFDPETYAEVFKTK